MSKKEYGEEDNRGTIRIVINDISTFLYKSGFLSKYLCDKKQIELLENNSKIDIIELFEFSHSITSVDAGVKYSDLLKYINKTFKSEIDYSFDSLYYQYLEYTKNNISLNVFLNCLIMINYILSNFNDLLNLTENCDFIEAFKLNKKISVMEIDNMNNNKDSFSYKLEDLYENINKKPNFKDAPINSSLIILIFLMTYDGKIIVDKEIPNILNLIEKFTLYNKIYFSNINISVFLNIQIITLINLYIKSNKTKKNYLIYNASFNPFYDFSSTENINNTNTTHLKNPQYSNKTQLLSTGRAFNYNLNENNLSKLEENTQKDNYEIPNCYLFDDEIMNHTQNPHIKLIFFQNYLKFFAFYYISKKKINFTLNLTIESIIELSKHFIKKIEEKEKENEKEKKNAKITSDIVIFNDNTQDLNLLLKTININNINMLTRDNITNIFSSLNFKEFLIKIMDFKSENQIEEINNKYFDLIAKSNSYYIQEPVASLINDKQGNNKNKTYNINDNLTMKDLFEQYDILHYYLDFFLRNHDSKKIPKSITIKFNTFKLMLNREIKKIQIFFNFSSIKEKTLFHYLKISSNILKLEKKYEEIILCLKEYKFYDSTIRLFQTNFRSHQVNFFFTLLTKNVIDFIESNKLNNKITILEMKFNTYNPNMKVYIKDETVKQRNRMNSLKQKINSLYYSNRISILNNYLEDLSQDWDLIVISDRDSDFKLLRTFEDNKIFFYISKDKSNIAYSTVKTEGNIQMTSVSSSSGNGNNEEKKNEGYEYLNIIMYFKNDESIFEKGIQFMENIQEDKNSILEYKTTLICDRFFLESNIIMEPRMKKSVKTMYTVIDDLFMIAKNIKLESDINDNEQENDQDNEYYNYDIYIADNFIAVSNYHLYNSKEDLKFSKIIFEFLSILSSCVELILYILKNKDTYIAKFVYLIKTTKDDYYIFEYKNSNMFIKKVKEFDSLISLDVKQCYPLFCFISKKTETKYTISNDNFYDVFLRLFLNLNKVVETRDKLNEIFLQKVHKNIFYEYYDSFLLIAYSFEAFNFFNDFLMQNDYLSITKGEKFDKCYIVLTSETSRKKNYHILLDNIKDNDNIVVQKLIIFNFNFKPSYFFSHKKLFFMSYHKSEYLINEETNRITTNTIPNLNKKLNAINKVFGSKNLDKNNLNKIMNKIKCFIAGGNNICLYNSNSDEFENILNDYNREKLKIKTQKVEMRVYQLTEEAKNTQNSLQNNKKDCNIF